MRRWWSRIACIVALACGLVAAVPASGAIGFLRQWPASGRGGGEAGVALDRAGTTVYVAQPSAGAVVQYTPEGRVVRTIGAATGVPLQGPSGLAVDSQGNLYVLQGGLGRIDVVGPTGAPLRSITPTGDDAIDALSQGLDIDAANNLYVADSRHSRILVLDPAGAVTRRIPLGGPFVNDVAVDAGGNVYAYLLGGDAGCSGTVERHAPDGTLLAKWPATQPPGATCARFGIAVDPTTNEVLLSSQGGSQPGVRRYTPAGAPVGAPLIGSGVPGQSFSAGGLAVDATGTIYAADTGDGRVLVFGEKAAAPPAPGPPPPNLGTTIPSPQTLTNGPTSLVAPGRISLRSLRRSKCVLVKVASSRPARVLVSIFSGRLSIRLFGQQLVVFRAPGRRQPCITVPFRAHTFNVRTPLRVALGYTAGARPQRTGRKPRPVIKPIRLVP
jgi:DNA-binding beta-propeller fold protein YncE